MKGLEKIISDKNIELENKRKAIKKQERQQKIANFLEALSSPVTKPINAIKKHLEEKEEERKFQEQEEAKYQAYLVTFDESKLGTKEMIGNARGNDTICTTFHTLMGPLSKKRSWLYQETYEGMVELEDKKGGKYWTYARVEEYNCGHAAIGVYRDENGKFVRINESWYTENPNFKPIGKQLERRFNQASQNWNVNNKYYNKDSCM